MLIKQYPAKEQAELRVRIKIPGTWFANLTPGERSKLYDAEAYASEASWHFPKVGARSAQTCAGMRFICPEDVFEDVNAGQFIMPLSDWNRYRHDTYKDRREDETVYIRNPAAAAIDIAGAPAAVEKPPLPTIYSEFELVNRTTHTVNPKTGAPPVEAVAELWKCKNTGGHCKHQAPFKVVKSEEGHRQDA